jgi:hypothetical protein
MNGMQEADLSSCSKRTKSRVIALGNYLKGYYASHFEYIVARRQRFVHRLTFLSPNGRPLFFTKLARH